MSRIFIAILFAASFLGSISSGFSAPLPIEYYDTDPYFYEEPYGLEDPYDVYEEPFDAYDEPPARYYDRPYVHDRFRYRRRRVYRPRSCGEYHYWDGRRCVDARYYPPYVGPKW